MLHINCESSYWIVQNSVLNLQRAKKFGKSLIQKIKAVVEKQFLNPLLPNGNISSRSAKILILI